MIQRIPPHPGSKSNTPAVITRDFNGQPFVFREDGYFNMTKAAQAFGKHLPHFWNSPDTDAYLLALMETSDSDVTDLVIAKRGVGTWGHPKLAVFFARWCDVKFSVWCDAMIDDILLGRALLTITDPENSELLKLREDFQATANALAQVDRQLTEVREALAVTMSENVQLKSKQEAETALTASEVLTRLGISGPRIGTVKTTS